MTQQSRGFFPLALIVFFFTLMMMGPTHAEVKCSCPTIKAGGEGNTSCSTSESGGRCTIDYNLFGTRENRAASILQQVLKRKFTAYSDLNTHDALHQAAERNEIPQQVLLYMLVATVDQLSSYDNTVPIKSFPEIQTQVEIYSDQIVKAFSLQKLSYFADLDAQRMSDPTHILLDHNGVVISYGCMSVQTSDLDRANPSCDGRR